MNDLKDFLRKAKEIKMVCFLNKKCHTCIYFNEKNDYCFFEEIFGKNVEFPCYWKLEGV